MSFHFRLVLSYWLDCIMCSPSQAKKRRRRRASGVDVAVPRVELERRGHPIQRLPPARHSTESMHRRPHCQRTVLPQSQVMPTPDDCLAQRHPRRSAVFHSIMGVDFFLVGGGEKRNLRSPQTSGGDTIYFAAKYGRKVT